MGNLVVDLFNPSKCCLDHVAKDTPVIDQELDAKAKTGHQNFEYPHPVVLQPCGCFIDDISKRLPSDVKHDERVDDQDCQTNPTKCRKTQTHECQPHGNCLNDESCEDRDDSKH